MNNGQTHTAMSQTHEFRVSVTRYKTTGKVVVDLRFGTESKPGQYIWVEESVEDAYTKIAAQFMWRAMREAGIKADEVAAFVNK
jgi:hypothetical protein